MVSHHLQTYKDIYFIVYDWSENNKYYLEIIYNHDETVYTYEYYMDINEFEFLTLDSNIINNESKIAKKLLKNQSVFLENFNSNMYDISPMNLDREFVLLSEMTSTDSFLDGYKVSHSVDAGYGLMYHDTITTIVPESWFYSAGTYSYVGEEYGLYVKTVKIPDRKYDMQYYYSTNVFVYDIDITRPFVTLNQSSNTDASNRFNVFTLKIEPVITQSYAGYCKIYDDSYRDQIWFDNFDPTETKIIVPDHSTYVEYFVAPNDFNMQITDNENNPESLDQYVQNPDSTDSNDLVKTPFTDYVSLKRFDYDFNCNTDISQDLKTLQIKGYALDALCKFSNVFTPSIFKPLTNLVNYAGTQKQEYEVAKLESSESSFKNETNALSISRDLIAPESEDLTANDNLVKAFKTNFTEYGDLFTYDNLSDYSHEICVELHFNGTDNIAVNYFFDISYFISIDIYDSNGTQVNGTQTNINEYNSKIKCTPTFHESDESVYEDLEVGYSYAYESINIVSGNVEVTLLNVAYDSMYSLEVNLQSYSYDLDLQIYNRLTGEEVLDISKYDNQRTCEYEEFVYLEDDVDYVIFTSIDGNYSTQVGLELRREASYFPSVSLEYGETYTKNISSQYEYMTVYHFTFTSGKIYNFSTESSDDIMIIIYDENGNRIHQEDNTSYVNTDDDEDPNLNINTDYYFYGAEHEIYVKIINRTRYSTVEFNIERK